jgi:hypothetical protein
MQVAKCRMGLKLSEKGMNRFALSVSGNNRQLLVECLRAPGSKGDDWLPQRRSSERC